MAKSGLCGRSVVSTTVSNSTLPGEGVVRGFKENDIEYVNLEDCSIEEAAVLAKNVVLA